MPRTKAGVFLLYLIPSGILVTFQVGREEKEDEALTITRVVLALYALFPDLGTNEFSI